MPDGGDETGQRRDNYTPARLGLGLVEACQSEGMCCSETVQKDRNNDSFSRRRGAVQTIRRRTTACRTDEVHKVADNTKVVHLSRSATGQTDTVI